MVKPLAGAAARLPSLCPRYHRAVEIVGARWNGAILQLMLNGATRFGAIEAGVPDLTSRMLSQRLKELEAEGLVARAVSAAPPVRVEYRLTPKGRALAPVVRALSAWAERWVAAPNVRKR